MDNVTLENQTVFKQAAKRGRPKKVNIQNTDSNANKTDEAVL